MSDRPAIDAPVRAIGQSDLVEIIRKVNEHRAANGKRPPIVLAPRGLNAQQREDALTLWRKIGPSISQTFERVRRKLRRAAPRAAKRPADAEPAAAPSPKRMTLPSETAK